MWYVYILECSDRRSYIGCTNNLKDRFLRHSKGYVSATKGRLPVKIYSYLAVSDKNKAFEFEKFLKSGAGRNFLKRRIF